MGCAVSDLNCNQYSRSAEFGFRKVMLVVVQIKIRGPRSEALQSSLQIGFKRLTRQPHQIRLFWHQGHNVLRKTGNPL